MKLPRNFFKPLAIGAPTPLRELPVKLERMIHFVPPHLEKLRAKVPELIHQVDVVLGNLEDAIPADAKEAARAGFIAMAKASDFGATGLWTRINALNSPWVLDDICEIVAAIGRKLDVIMLPKVEGDMGHPLPRPASRPARSQARGQQNRSSFTPSSRPPKASTTSPRSPPLRRACTASASVRPTLPRRAR